MQISSPYKVVLCILVVCTQFIIWASEFNLRLNLSNSMPIGFYRLYPGKLPQRGDWVSVCLQNPVAHQALQQGHVHPGRCPTGVEPLIKAVIATPQDHVIVSKRVVLVGDSVYISPVQRFDRQQQRLTPYADRAMLIHGGYWLYGINNPKYSWDSRYFGPVDSVAIQGVVKPLLIWKYGETLGETSYDTSTPSHSAGNAPFKTYLSNSQNPPKPLKSIEKHPPALLAPVDLFEASLKFPDHAHTT